ncbi:ExbD/TolR family protein [Tenacibaculum aquimarinum]|uniref:ExbD/TolR family protein n=1 Tax=Tenacibaculum aquimarinum TaxID=2910675 RepID=UPI00293F6369|nr:biopolymer transporter ExbD [Tenacibaculum aquimarinum]
MSKQDWPEINAGSMADIAFLLLIFFLVTTTMDVDSGILKKIPQEEKHPREITIKEKNLLEITINKNNELFINEQTVAISELKEIALNFIDNGGGLNKDGQECNWCNGNKNPKSSDHPTKAIIAIDADRNADYGTYISVLDNINSAYDQLRNKLSVKLYGKNYNALEGAYKKASKNKEPILKKIKNIREKYPLLISDIDVSPDMAKR